jgi:hypothetical protein
MNEHAEVTPHSAWHTAVDALGFQPQGHRGLCLVHRLAFRTLLGVEPTPADCHAYFDEWQTIFQRAAAAKIRRAGLSVDVNFHLSSRDIRRAQK